ncbi:MAG: 23S rRNA (guanine2445-N2)-methyltransferase / 23S rRNA (guanine2069-N7)-methyltransferase [Oceanicoccus sp.]|jgi:23S rRNA (guanine2445-N2)-methyltransferase / 23S rRNA (guanine2069-N7)-methyltransferase
MDGTLDIQRDHVSLIKDTMKLLSKNGMMIFSTNQRNFKLSEQELKDFELDDKTGWSIDKDFQRSKKIHHCWFFSHNNG